MRLMQQLRAPAQTRRADAAAARQIVERLGDRCDRSPRAHRADPRARASRPARGPRGMSVGRSLSECTQQSTFFAASASSSSFVKSPFAPIALSDSSSFLSPTVLKVTSSDSTPSSRAPPAPCAPAEARARRRASRFGRGLSWSKAERQLTPLASAPASLKQPGAKRCPARATRSSPRPPRSRSARRARGRRRS